MSTTVLDIVQDMLSAIDSDEVNSIGDTTEAMSAARLVSNVYDNIVDEHSLKSVSTLFQLVPTSTPVIMTIPTGFHSIQWIKYDISGPEDPTDYNTILYCPPDAFMGHVEGRSLEDNPDLIVTEEITISNGIKFFAYFDRAPEIWTTFDDVSVVFDSYNKDYDAVLQGSKTNCYGEGKPSLTVDDTTPIALSPRYITLLRTESIAMAQDLWKDGVTPKIEQSAQRMRVRAQRTKHIDAQSRATALPDYGRKRR
jgi:hypothetical protein